MASNQQSTHGVSNAKDAQNPRLESPYYYIDPSETRESFKPPLVLSGPDNCRKWYRAMSVALASKKKLVFADGTVAVPAKDDTMCGAWKQCNDLLLSWITKSVSSEIADSVKGMSNAVDVWRNLKERFLLRDEFIISDILEEIYSLKQGERDMAGYFTEFTLLWSELEILCRNCALRVNKQKIEEQKVARFLKGLDERFDATRSRIMREDPLPPIGQVYAWLVQEECLNNKRHQSQTPCSPSHQAMPTTTQTGKV